MSAEWPVPLSGVVESVTTTLGPNDRWNAAPLGLHVDDDHDPTAPVRARSWGRTRTWRNFEHEGEGYVQFVRDPLVFADAALGVLEVDDPVLDAATAWARVDATLVGTGERDGTRWADWTLTPTETGIEQRAVPTTERSYAAVVEMTVAASRLGVSGYDDETLRDRLDYFAEVARRCGGQRERAAVDRVAELSEWGADDGSATPEADAPRAGRVGQ
ncbi:DUF447 domain-containing protein [Haloarculaceae archaeon H-GB2-1]|nr:DUF447 family protein [Haloarculaceae archaeon H-GB1-1]MEA5385731.1 DUF447 domain-containing protein [Haloarculaceae archaeon H-GB11]MEA5407232.1 DUF447 domain-containing protein [Haloarculaceae archaeon H-GB2-1]